MIQDFAIEQDNDGSFDLVVDETNMIIVGVEGMETAVRNAKAWLTAAIAAADRFSVGHGHGPVHHFHTFY